jgi:hypothetical protein
MEFRRGDHLGQLFHVCRLNIDYVEALILDVEVPKVDAKIVAADEGLAITVDRYAIDVVCVGIRICPPGDSSNDGVMMGHPR